MRCPWAALLAVLSACTADPDIVAVGVAQTGGGAPAPAVFHTRGATILDPCGDPVVFRGVNEMAAYLSADRDGAVWLSEIATTNANAVRFWWHAANGAGFKALNADELEALLLTAEKYGLTPMPTIHYDSGAWSTLDEQVGLWLDPLILDVVKRHQQYMLLNISDALGETADTPDAATWAGSYAREIQTLRARGLQLPIVIDAPFRGMNAAALLDEHGKMLLASDPNLILSLHMFWRPDMTELPHAETDVQITLQQARAQGLPLVITAFAPTNQDCKSGVFYRQVLENAGASATGWFAWSWGAAHNAVSCGTELDMTTGGLRTSPTQWGTEAMGYLSSASPTYFQRNGACRPPADSGP